MRYGGSSYYNGNSEIQKSIRISKDVETIINSIEGRSFSDKIRRMAYEHNKVKQMLNEYEKLLKEKYDTT
jgi:hypothetical protein